MQTGREIMNEILALKAKIRRLKKYSKSHVDYMEIVRLEDILAGLLEATYMEEVF